MTLLPNDINDINSQTISSIKLNPNMETKSRYSKYIQSN